MTWCPDVRTNGMFRKAMKKKSAAVNQPSQDQTTSEFIQINDVLGALSPYGPSWALTILSLRVQAHLEGPNTNMSVWVIKKIENV